MAGRKGSVTKHAAGKSGERRTPAAAPASSAGSQLDPVSVKEAADSIGATRSEAVGAALPEDSPPPTADRGSDTFTFGNRTFDASPQSLGDRRLDVLPDLPDIRDRMYLPTLRSLKPGIYPTIAFPVRDQSATSSCTGFALAHVIDCLMYREVLTDGPRRVSARMLYEMAKRNDEWTGTAYEGSSVRGAINGFYRNGVCDHDLSPDGSSDEWVLTYDMNRAARQNRLGAYYRLQPDLSDYHAALNEIGAICASARIHRNWREPINGRIEPGGEPAGGHAFAIVGYDEDGFWVLNSWGAGWGKNGVAHWRYEDWAATMMDAWVLQLGVRAPAAFSAFPRPAPAGVSTPQVVAAPNRGDIVGHFINIDDGRYVTGGRYASPSQPEMAETVRRLSSDAANGGEGYDHLVIYAHGGLNSADAEANRIATWQRHNIFGRNRIYNFHLMWNSGLLDAVFHPLAESQAGRAAGALGDLIFETGALKAIGSQAWRNMKQDAGAAFDASASYDGGFVGLSPLLQGLDDARRRPVLHLVGHSAGAIMLARLLGSLDRFGLRNIELGSIHLMAPACTVELFDEAYGRYIAGQGSIALKDKVYLYGLNSRQELADTVGIGGFGYGRSLLYLVSRAYEDAANTPLAGMQIYATGLPQSGKISVAYSPSALTASTSHGGFDNDVATLSTIMSRVLGHPAPAPPLRDELTGY